ncbi:MAG TPA: potassium-transporting ATPase subunit C [Candidatus Deferrimicrobium sp.]|nr:potassium-transporting ATPase subunit C [Candidatus Deferrimicrobium sp.]
MSRKLLHELWLGTRITLVITIVCGIAYPLLMTGVSQLAFNGQANGSLVTDSQGTVVGSTLIGQCYYKTTKDASGNLLYQTVKDKSGNDLYFVVDPRYFQSRPLWAFTTTANANGTTTSSLLQPVCNAASSLGSNLGPGNSILIAHVTAYTAYLHSLGVAKNADGSNAPMPIDLVTGDFTGFDPDISEAAALAQVNMVAGARHLDVTKLTALVEAHVSGRSLGVFGSPHVTVLSLNMALDAGAAS